VWAPFLLDFAYRTLPDSYGNQSDNELSHKRLCSLSYSLTFYFTLHHLRWQIAVHYVCLVLNVLAAIFEYITTSTFHCRRQFLLAGPFWLLTTGCKHEQFWPKLRWWFANRCRYTTRLLGMLTVVLQIQHFFLLSGRPSYIHVKLTTPNKSTNPIIFVMFQELPDVIQNRVRMFPLHTVRISLEEPGTERERISPKLLQD
jgi:hypothetical protein